MSWESICNISDIPPNAGVAALVNGHQIAIFKVKGEIYAIDNKDPISGANILSRGIVGCIKEELCVASPLYKQHFSLLSGQCIEEEGVQVSLYPLRLQGETVELDTSTISKKAA